MNYKIVIYIIILVIIISCDEATTIKKTSVNFISINQKEFYYDDTLYITGSGFKSDWESMKLTAQSNKDTINLTQKMDIISDSKIEYVNDSLVGKYTLILEIDDYRSENYEVEFFLYPRIETIQIKLDTFTMGSKNGYIEELPLRKIYLNKEIIVSKYEINEKIYKDIMDLSGRKSDILPMKSIEWSEAIEFCNRLSKISRLDTVYSLVDDVVNFDTTANGWRLLTEAEWEALAKSGTNNDYPDIFKPQDYAWFNQNSGFNPQPIGLLKSNLFGLYDMNGNLAEWVWDYYEKYNSNDTIYPLGIQNGTIRIARGGSYKSGVAWIRNTSRKLQYYDIQEIGLRICRNVY